MLASSTVFIISLIYTAAFSVAQIGPTTPGPNETFKTGSPCKIAWLPDSSGSWTNMTIALMAGSNSNMSLVTKVAEGLDGTNASLTPFSWTCPEVTPYSAIYFYQFTNGNLSANSTWTTRFTIASPAGVSDNPENLEQPNGDRVPWGAGQLKSTGSSNDTSVSQNTSVIRTQPLAEHVQAPFTIALPTPALPVPSSMAHDSHTGRSSKHQHSKHQKTRLATSEASETSRHSTVRKDAPSTEAPWPGLAEASPSGYIKNDAARHSNTVGLLKLTCILTAVVHVLTLMTML